MSIITSLVGGLFCACVQECADNTPMNISRSLYFEYWILFLIVRCIIATDFCYQPIAFKRVLESGKPDTMSGFRTFIITKFKRNLIGRMVLLQTEQLASNDMPVY